MCKLPVGRYWWWVELGVVLVAELSKTLVCLSADGCGWVPSLLVVWPEATKHWSLPSSLVGLMADSGRAHPRTSAASVLVLMVSHSHALPLQETLQH